MAAAADPLAAAGRGLDLRLALPAAAAWCGAFTGTSGSAFGRPAELTAAAVMAAAAGLCWRSRPTVAGALACGVAALLVGLFSVAQLGVGPVDELARRDMAARLVLVVTGDPRRRPASTPGQGAGDTIIVPARVAAVARGSATVRVRSPVLVFASDKRWGHLLPGQRLTTWGRLGPAQHGQALAAVVTVRGPPRLTGRPPPVQRLAGHLREALREAVRSLPAGERGLVPGLVVGDTSAMPPDLTEDFRTAGLTHLTAVSGANLAILCGFVVAAGRWAGVRGRWLPFCGLLALVGFVVLARPQPSVLRAAAMGGVGLVALATGRRRGAFAALAAAVLVLVLLDPWLARSYGFVLSVLATGGLLLLAPPWAQRLRGLGLPSLLAQALAVPAAAQVVCAPVIVLLSGQVSLVAVPANLAAAPAVAPATVLGVMATLGGGLSPLVGQVFGWAAGVPAWWIVTVARRSAEVPLAAAAWSSSATGAVELTVLTAVVVLGLGHATRSRRGAALAVTFVVVTAAVPLAARTWPPPGWLLVACDVGQGDALVLSTGVGSAVVIDAGPDPRLVDRCLRRLGVHSIPLVLLTHLHADHVEGLPGVLHGRQVGQLELGPYDEPAAELVRVRRWAQEAAVPITPALLDERVDVGPLSWRVLWPQRVIEGEGSVPNNASVVVLATLSGVRLLLTGDIEPAAQRAIEGRGAPDPVDVLKVPHHGSANQDPAFIRDTAPRLALVSVGVGNRYGHPARSTLRMLAGLGAVVGRTDQDGALAVVGPRARLRLVRSGR